MIPALYSRLPLTERVTYYYDFKASILYAIFYGTVVPLIPIIGRKMGMTPFMLALIGTFPFVGNLFSIYLGHLSEKHRKMPFMFWPTFLARIILVFAAFIGSPLLFLVLAGAFYIISNLPGPAYASIIQANYTPQNRSMLMGNIRIEIMLIASLFAWVAGKLLNLHHEAYRVLFPVAGVLGAWASIVFAKIRVRGEGKPDRVIPKHFTFSQSLAIIGKDRLFLVFQVIVWLIAFPNKLTIPVEPIRLVDELHMDYESAGLIQGTIVSLTSLAGYLFWSTAARKANPLLILSIAGVLTSLRDLNVGLAQNVQGLIPGAVILGIGNSAWDLMPLFILMNFAGPGKLSLYFGFHAGLVGIRGILGPVLGSFLYSELGVPSVTLYIVSSSFAMAGAVCLFIFTAYMKRRQAGLQPTAPGARENADAAAS